MLYCIVYAWYHLSKIFSIQNSRIHLTLNVSNRDNEPVLGYSVYSVKSWTYSKILKQNKNNYIGLQNRYIFKTV